MINNNDFNRVFKVPQKTKAAVLAHYQGVLKELESEIRDDKHYEALKKCWSERLYLMAEEIIPHVEYLNNIKISDSVKTKFNEYLSTF